MSERGNYRSIPRALFSARDFRLLPERARWVFVVLKMNLGQAGIDTVYPDELAARLSAETGASTGEVNETLAVLEKHGWIEREDNLLWVKGQLKNDPHMTAANVKHRARIQRHVGGLPRSRILTRFCKEHSEWLPREEVMAKGIEWVSNGYAEGIAIRSRKRKENRNPKAAGDDGPAGADSPYAFMGSMRSVWLRSYGGPIPAGSAKVLQALVREYGEDEVARRFGIYCSATMAAYASVPRFVSTFGSWQTEPISKDDSRLIGVGGVPTADELDSVGIRLQ